VPYHRTPSLDSPGENDLTIEDKRQSGIPFRTREAAAENPKQLMGTQYVSFPAGVNQVEVHDSLLPEAWCPSTLDRNFAIN